MSQNTQTDVEKQDKINETTNNATPNNDAITTNDGLEKVKQVKIPGINAAEVVIYGIFSSMFIIGWVNLNNCPLNIMIPIYLIVAGFIGSAIKFLSTTRNKHLFNVFLLIVLLYSIWTILGSYWVYREYQPNYYEKDSREYCNRTTYLLAFWILTVQYGVLCLCITLSGCYILMRGDFRR